MITAPLLQVVEQAGEGVLVLTDGLTEPEFLRSRLTRAEVRRQLLLIAGTLGGLPDGARQAMPEVDWDGWQHLGRALGAPREGVDEGSEWFAAQSLVPALLSWLRVYKRAEPALFEFRA